LVCTGDQVRIKEYWDLTYHTDELPRSEESYQIELCDILRESVKIRLRSDVPLGAFLSGGIDSSSVVAFMAEQLDRPVVTCSVGFSEIAHNELSYARSVARHLHCNHNEELIAPSLGDEILKIAEFFDEPFGDSSAIPTYYVSQMARRHVTVALSGDGGDETFAGYSRHYLHVFERRIQRVLGLGGGRLLSKVGASLPVKGRPLLRRLGMPPDMAYAWKQCNFLFNDQQKSQLYSGSLRDDCNGFDPSARLRSYYNRCTALDPLNKALYVDLKTYLVDDILVKVDRMSMAHGLEVRSPLLDHKLLEFAATLPTGLKLKGQMTKVALRRVMKERVPREILTRRKQGFTMPVAEWLRKPLRAIVEDCLFAPRSIHRGLFNGAFLRRLWSDHLHKRRDYSQHLWLLMVFELWHRKYLDDHS